MFEAFQRPRGTDGRKLDSPRGHQPALAEPVDRSSPRNHLANSTFDSNATRPIGRPLFPYIFMCTGRVAARAVAGTHSANAARRSYVAFLNSIGVPSSLSRLDGKAFVETDLVKLGQLRPGHVCEIDRRNGGARLRIFRGETAEERSSLRLRLGARSNVRRAYRGAA
jgi:hypothetical protein